MPYLEQLVVQSLYNAPTNYNEGEDAAQGGCALCYAEREAYMRSGNNNDLLCTIITLGLLTLKELPSLFTIKSFNLERIPPPFLHI